MRRKDRLGELLDVRFCSDGQTVTWCESNCVTTDILGMVSDQTTMEQGGLLVTYRQAVIEQRYNETVCILVGGAFEMLLYLIHHRLH